MVSMERPLDGIRVIDTSTGPAGGLATMVLADFGADVIKVEPPGGDRFRALAASPLWLRGKRSVVLDLATADGLDSLHALVTGADVVVTSGPPGRAARWGIDAAGCTALRRDVIHCSLTGWGEVGPLAGVPGYPSTVAARAGRMQMFSGQIPRPGPVYSAVPVSIHMVAHAAVQGIVSGLLARGRTGQPHRVTTSLLQAMLPFDLFELLLVQLMERGESPVSADPTERAMPTLNYHPVMASDGRWIQCGNLMEHLFLAFLDAIDLYGELLADERFIEPPAKWSPDAIEHARDRILDRVRTKPAREWMEIFHDNGNVAAEPYLSPREALGHRDLVDNGAIVEVLDPVFGPIRMIGPIATLTASPATVRVPAPRVGEHSEQILADMAGDRGPSPLSQPGTSEHALVSNGRPLAGFTVLEFASVIAGPLGTSMLADLGARVIRVEPLEGDPFRFMLSDGVMAVKTTAGKESICIDLKRPDGREIVQRLVDRADVLVHNYRPGVPERLGVGYEQLVSQHPSLVWVAVTGYGTDGPSAHRPATHPCAGAAMGGAGYQAGSILGAHPSTLDELRESARQLIRANDSNPDPNTSAIVASATVIALLARERDPDRKGQRVLVDMMTANAHANADAFLEYANMPARPPLDDQLFGTGACDRLYRCASGWVLLTLTTDGEWERFCTATGNLDLVADPRFADVTGRTQNGEQLSLLLADLFLSRSAPEWEAALRGVGVACVQADGATPGTFAARDEHMHLNGFVPFVQHRRFGEIRRWGPIVHIDGCTDGFGPGVLAGEHTDALLAELGYDGTEIESFRSERVAGSENVRSPAVT